MKVRKLIYLVILALASACSGPEEDEASLSGSRAQHRSVTFLSDNPAGYSVTAFREENGGYYYQDQFNDGWSADGKLRVQLPVGNYKFLVAYSYGVNTSLQPVLQPAGTSFDAIYFASKPGNGAAGTILPADELFLQERRADSIYKLTTATTVRCTLKRAVAQVRLLVKRGRQTGPNTFEPIPYTGDDNLLRYFSKVQLDLAGVGTSVNALATPGGSGNITTEIPVAQRDSITSEGFAAFTGPYFFPAADGRSIDFTVTLHRADNSPLSETIALRVSRAMARNQQLVITAWIASDWNFVGVTTDTLPITKTIDGEQDIWDDNVEQL